MRLDKPVRKAGSVVGAELDTLTSVAEKRILGKISWTMSTTLCTKPFTGREAPSVTDCCPWPALHTD